MKIPKDYAEASRRRTLHNELLLEDNLTDVYVGKAFAEYESSKEHPSFYYDHTSKSAIVSHGNSCYAHLDEMAVEDVDEAFVKLLECSSREFGDDCVIPSKTKGRIFDGLSGIYNKSISTGQEAPIESIIVSPKTLVTHFIGNRSGKRFVKSFDKRTNHVGEVGWLKVYVSDLIKNNVVYAVREADYLGVVATIQRCVGLAFPVPQQSVFTLRFEE